MSTRVTLTCDDAEVVAVKAATTPDQVAALAREATRLQQAGHPGVVAFLEHRVTDDRAELHTRYAGEPLGCWRGTPTAAAGLVAAVAATVADLHELGVVHGRIDLSHILLDADGRPRLCGWSSADDSAPPVDVAALGRLLAALVERAAPSGGVRPSWFLWARARAADERALAQVVAHATDPVASRRPTARALARSILSAVPGAELAPVGRAPNEAPAPAPGRGPSPDGRAHEPGSTALDPLDRLVDPAVGLDSQVDEVFGDQSAITIDEVFVDRGWDDPATGPSPGSPRRRARALALAAIALVFAAAAAGAYAYRAGAPSDVGAQEPVAAPPASTAARPCAPTDAPPGAGTQADIDGDGCLEAVVVRDGVVETAGQRWAIGAPGDLVAVGDWDCDGRATPAVYRPASGDVFVFADWAGADQPLTVEATAQVLGGRGLTRASPGPADSTAAPCDRLSVDLATGPHIVEVTP
ncbi:MAG: hypothetical protein ACRD2C_24975 [Acidimicrobiales bacterium]